MKLIETKEIPLRDLIRSPLVIEREDLGKIDEITGDIFTPIIVVPSKKHHGKYERITGLRRFKKAEKDKKSTILCVVYEMTDEEAVKTHAKENLQRKGLNYLEEGRLYKHTLEKLSEIRGKKATQEELAKILTAKGKKTSQENINNKMRLLNLAKPIQNYLALNKLGLYNALLLFQIKDENLQIEIANEAIENSYTNEKLKARIKKLPDMLERYQYYGQHMFQRDGRCLPAPSPSTIQPPIGRIKLITQEPICGTRIIELCAEVYEIQKNFGKCEASCCCNSICNSVFKYYDKVLFKRFTSQEDEARRVSDAKVKDNTKKEPATGKIEAILEEILETAEEIEEE